MASQPKIRTLVKIAEQNGWSVRVRTSGHVWFYAPDGVSTVSVSGTPSDHRAWKNARAAFRRAGLEMPAA